MVLINWEKDKENTYIFFLSKDNIYPIKDMAYLDPISDNPNKNFNIKESANFKNTIYEKMRNTHDKIKLI